MKSPCSSSSIWFEVHGTALFATKETGRQGKAADITGNGDGGADDNLGGFHNESRTNCHQHRQGSIRGVSTLMALATYMHEKMKENHHSIELIGVSTLIPHDYYAREHEREPLFDWVSEVNTLIPHYYYAREHEREPLFDWVREVNTLIPHDYYAREHEKRTIIWLSERGQHFDPSWLLCTRTWKRTIIRLSERGQHFDPSWLLCTRTWKENHYLIEWARSILWSLTTIMHENIKENHYSTVEAF